MSLINKMLQDLDARGTPAGDAFPEQIKPVEREPYRPNVRAIAAAVGGGLAGLALAWFGWAQYQQRHVPAPVPAKLGAAHAAQAPAVPAAVVTAALPAAPQAAAPAPAPAPAGDPAAKTVAPLDPGSDEARAARQALARELDARTDALKARIAALADAPSVHAAEAPAPRARHQDARKARATRDAEAQPKRHAARRGAEAAAGAAGATPAPKARTEGRAGHPATRGAAAVRGPNAAVRAEAEYRRALASLQEGRMGETVAALENALKIEPGHEAARQTLVGLLVEAGRGDEAMRQLQLGLTLDPRQPALAMLLARLQIEHGGNGIDTLTRTLPYAGNNADYRAFLAGALQRQQRHREAAEQYQAALRGAPGNAVWWMGLGMSLQADKRNGEALDAFQKARTAGLPSAELQTFVERRIAQLGR